MAHIVVQVRDAHAGLGAARWGYAWRGAACLGAAWPAEAPQGLVHNEGEWTTPEFESPAPTLGRAVARLGSAVLGVAWHREARAPQGGGWQPLRFEAWASTQGGTGLGWARRGTPRRGKAGQGERGGWTACSEVRALGTHARRDLAGFGEAWLALARRRSARRGTAWHGKGNKADGRHTPAFKSPASTRGWAPQCRALLVAASLGWARHRVPRPVKAWVPNRTTNFE